MSFILKALKKVEEEKKAHHEGPVDLNSAILRSGGAPVPSAPRLARWGVIALVFTTGCGLTYVLVQKGSGPAAEIPRQTASLASPPPVPSKPPPAEAIPSQPAAPTDPLSVTRRANASVTPSGPAEASPRTGRKTPAPDQTPRHAVSQAEAPPTGLKVNGIALQDDPDESVAVVNGALLKRGMTIEGARVEEIFADRVRFAGSGGTFDVSLSR